MSTPRIQPTARLQPEQPVGLGTFVASDRAREYVNDVLDSGRLSYGPYSQRLERDFARIHDCSFGVFSNSGTSALHLAVQALKELRGWKDGDEVLVPAVTFVATVNILLHLQLKPVLVDVEPDFYGMRPDLAEAAITSRTRAILPVHLFGQPCDMTRLMELASKHGLAVVEDSCETMFARHRGRMAGSFGDVGCFSTYIAHLLVTGVGGICTASDPELAVRIRSLANHGRDGIYISIDDDKGKDDELRETIVDRRFRFEHVGHSFRATELEAALGCAALETWEQMIAARRRNAAYLGERLAAYSDRIQLPATRPGTEHSFMMYPLVLRDLPKRDLVQHLERNGVETRDMLPILPQPVYRDRLDIPRGRFPVAEWIDSSGFYVGCHQGLSHEQLDHVATTLIAWLRKQRSQRAA
jgi:dTDP-4-amino-4,6-dideoxygalactose transaminase